MVAQSWPAVLPPRTNDAGRTTESQKPDHLREADSRTSRRHEQWHRTRHDGGFARSPAVVTVGRTTAPTLALTRRSPHQGGGPRRATKAGRLVPARIRRDRRHPRGTVEALPSRDRPRHCLCPLSISQEAAREVYPRCRAYARCAARVVERAIVPLGLLFFPPDQNRTWREGWVASGVPIELQD